MGLDDSRGETDWVGVVDERVALLAVLSMTSGRRFLYITPFKLDQKSVQYLIFNNFH